MIIASCSLFSIHHVVLVKMFLRWFLAIYNAKYRVKMTENSHK